MFIFYAFLVRYTLKHQTDFFKIASFSSTQIVWRCFSTHKPKYEFDNKITKLHTFSCFYPMNLNRGIFRSLHAVKTLYWMCEGLITIIINYQSRTYNYIILYIGLWKFNSFTYKNFSYLHNYIAIQFACSSSHIDRIHKKKWQSCNIWISSRYTPQFHTVIMPISKYKDVKSLKRESCWWDLWGKMKEVPTRGFTHLSKRFWVDTNKSWKGKLENLDANLFSRMWHVLLLKSCATKTHTEKCDLTCYSVRYGIQSIYHRLVLELGLLSSVVCTVCNGSVWFSVRKLKQFCKVITSTFHSCR